MDQQAVVPNPVSLMRTKLGFDESIRSRREADVAKISAAIRSHEQDNYMSAEDFAKYEELYSNENRQKILSGDISDDEQERLMILSLELSQRINMYKPLHVIDDDGNDLFPPLPPMLTRINSLHGHGSEAINIFHNAFSRDENTPMGSLQQRKAAENLSRLISMSQSQDQVLEKVREFDEMADEFHQHKQGRNTFPQGHTDIPADVTDKSIPVTSKKAESMDFFDFEDEVTDD